MLPMHFNFIHLNQYIQKTKLYFGFIKVQKKKEKERENKRNDQSLIMFGYTKQDYGIEEKEEENKNDQ